MRSWAERMMNSKLNGYTVKIARVRPHLWKLAFELDDLVLVQNSDPDPPVANFGALKFSMLWAELLRFRVAGDLTFDRPVLHINLAQIEEESHSQLTLKERGWQSAVESIFPIKLDRVRIQDGSLLYLSADTLSKPLQLTNVFMFAQNVRNIAAAKGTYPSPVALEGVLFDSGKVWFMGAADFLREPYVAARGEIRLDQVPLDRLNPLAQDYQLETTGGLLSLNGIMEYTPESQTAHLREVLFDNLQVDFVTSNATKLLEREHARQVVKLAKRVRNAPHLLLKLDSLKLINSQVGFVNKSAQPPYRLFMSKVNLGVKNMSNQTHQGRSEFQARGDFMGSGATAFSGGVQSTAKPANFDVRLKLDNARLRDLNPFLTANVGTDVAGGLFSVYTEISVKDSQMKGYLKPLIKGLKVYDRQKDQAKSFMKRIKLHFWQFIADLMKNHSTHEVATLVTLSGSTHDPKVSEWEVIRRLIGNAFSKAILPGFLGKAKPAETAPKPKPAPH
jgi:hypothetical protein